MSGMHYALFDTVLGRCGIAWNRRGVRVLQLPEARDALTVERLGRRAPEAVRSTPAGPAAQAIREVGALLAGEASKLEQVALDMEDLPAFHRRVYEVARAIAPGKTLTYGELAARVGSPGAARAVGQAMGRNPFVIIVPCHRVLAAGGRLGGFSAHGGIVTKLKLLAIEAGSRGGDLFSEDETGFGFDPSAAVAHLRAADPALADLIDAVGPFRMRLKRTPSIYAALAEAIVYQQLTGRAAGTIWARVCALYPNAHAGPTPEMILRTSDEKLRGAGLSGGKLLALRDLARRTVAGEIPTLAEARDLDDTQLIERLTAVRGIGRWTVEMLLMFRLGRSDVLPVDDLGIRKGYAQCYRKRTLPEPEVLRRAGARWAPYRSVASWYLWRALDLPEQAA